MVLVSLDLTQNLFHVCQVAVYLTLSAVASMNHLKARIILAKRIIPLSHLDTAYDILHELFVERSSMNVL